MPFTKSSESQRSTWHAKRIGTSEREKFAQALATGFKAVEAGKLVSYSAANSRRNARRSDVKVRVAELQKPALDKVAEQIDLSVEWALNRLYNIASPDLGVDAIKTPDQLRAIELLAKIKGWMAPEKQDVTVHDANRMTTMNSRVSPQEAAKATTSPHCPRVADGGDF